MKTLIRLFLTAIAVLVIAYALPNNWVVVEDFGAALLVALVLGILKVFVKPLLILFTLPITVLTFGLFLFVINAMVILLADYIVEGFDVKGFWVALLFSFILAFLQSILYTFLEEKKPVK
ncbi:MAG: phage holin family protein [Flavobacteriaceae bacterium]|nr:phage holin family protein [Flavobacteriaceae bacterium]